MGKIVMPKNSALLNEIEAVLKIYYEANDWLPNDEYKTKLKEMIGADQYSSSYTKKSQITSYFGFTIWEDIHNAQSRRKITETGKKMYEALENHNTTEVQEILMSSLEKVKFGRNNYGCPESDSDIEPPALFIRAILDLGYLTYKEFAFLLWQLEDIGANYSDVLPTIKEKRTTGIIELGEEAIKYTDCKPIMILVRWGFLSEDESDSTGGKHIIINPEVLSKFENRLRNLKIYNIDMDCDEPIVDEDMTNHISFEEKRKTSGINVLLYGVPGSGKSWTIEHEYCKPTTKVERLVFHPDYTNADFIGQILPVVDADNQVTYEFVSGPFTSMIKDAYENPQQEYVLIIEEINRGNAPAIFGEVFQLLDRNKLEKEEDGIKYPKYTSEYGITHKNMALCIYGDERRKVRIPSNLSIIGTMNTSDQNVFTLDTAFQRRWQMRLIENNFDNVRKSLREANILDTEVTWRKFCETINSLIVGNRSKMASAEDKRLGVYFVHEDILEDQYKLLPSDPQISLKDEYVSLINKERDGILVDKDKERLTELRDGLQYNREFPEKVIKYLWDDAFKFNHEYLFDSSMDSLEKVINEFIYSSGTERFKIFTKTVYDSLYS